LIKILDYFHYSNQDIESDSNFYFHKKLISYLSQDKNLHIYLTCPKEHSKIFYKTFDYDNVEIVPIEYVATAMWQRNWLDYHGLRDELGKTIIDIAFVNTPELAIDVVSALSYYSKPRLITYTHWVPETEGSLGPYSPAEKFLYLGAYSIAHYNCFNSKYGIELIYNHLKNYISDNMYKMFMQRAVPIAPYLEDDLINYKLEQNIYHDKNMPVAIFNHRISEYTGYLFLFDLLEYYDKHYNEPFILQFSKFADINTMVKGKTLSKLDLKNIQISDFKINTRKDYYDALLSSDIAFGFHNGKSQWSMSFMDALLADNIPLFRDKFFFKEIFDNYPLNLSDLRITNNKISDTAMKLNYIIKNINEFKNNYKFKDFILSKYNSNIISEKYRQLFYNVYNTIPDSHGLKSDKLNFERMQKELLDLIDISNLTNQGSTRDFNAIIKNLVNNYGFNEILRNKRLYLQHKNSLQKVL